MGQRAKRIASIDFWRAVAIFAVIAIHTTPFRVFQQPLWVALRVVINQSARFAVPYFFIVSGYLWGRKMRAGAKPFRVYGAMSKRLLLPFLIWSVLYVVLPTAVDLDAMRTYGYQTVVHGKVDALLAHPWALALEGGKVHLWFLVALFCAVTLATLLYVLRRPGALLPLGLILYGVGLLGGPYAGLVPGFHIGINTRDGPFVSTVFFALGWHLARRDRPPAARQAAAIFLLGWGMQVAESLWLGRHFDIQPTQVDAVVGTLAFGYGAALLALAYPRLGTNGTLPKLLARAGRETMGVYLVHIFFVDWLRLWIDARHRVLWELAYPVAVYLLSLLSVWVYGSVRRPGAKSQLISGRG